MSNVELINFIQDAKKPPQDIMLLLWQNNSGLIHRAVYRWQGLGISFEDLKQEAYFALVLAVKRYKAGGGFYAFSTILTNTLHWYFIRLKHNNAYIDNEIACLNSPISREDTDAEQIDLLPADVDIENEVIERLTNSELVRLCIEAINGLETDMQNALTYRYIKGYTVYKTAELMNITPQFVNKLCSKGIGKIHRDYKLRYKIRQLTQEDNIHSAGLKCTSFSSFVEHGSSSQELYILWKERQGAKRTIPCSQATAIPI